MRRSRTDGW
jgi:hypothetical protein